MRRKLMDAWAAYCDRQVPTKKSRWFAGPHRLHGSWEGERRSSQGMTLSTKFAVFVPHPVLDALKARLLEMALEGRASTSEAPVAEVALR